MKYLLNWKSYLFIAFILIAASVVYSNYASNKANEGVVITQHTKGNTDAGVVLTEYSDFQCPACGQFYPVVKSLMDQYGDKMALEYKHFPLITLHQFAVPAAKAAEAAGQQGKFWEMHDKLFENQSVWSAQGVTNPRPYFDQYAEELGLDMDLFAQHYSASMIGDHIQEQFNEARQLGLTGTPSFYLNGERLEFSTFEEFTGKIEAAIGITPVDASTTATTNAKDKEDVVFGF